MWVYDPETLRFLAVNDAAEALYGWSREEFMAMSIAQIRAEQDVDQLLDHLRTTADGTLVSSGVWRHRRRDGSVIDVEIRRHAIDAFGRAAALALVLDVSDRIRAERAVRESERFLRTALDSLPANIAILDPDGRIVAVNRAWRDFAVQNHARPQAVCEGADYFTACDAATPEDAAAARAFAAGIRDVMAGRLPGYSFEYPCHSPSVERWFVAHASRLVDADSQHVVVSHIDVTERRQAQRAYRSQAEQLKAYVAASPCVVYALAIGDGRFVPEWVSESVETLLGYPVEQALAPDWWWRNVHPDDRARAAAAFDALRDVDSTTHEYRFRRGDGSWIWIHDQLRQQRDADGRRTRVIGAWTDITGRKHTEETLLKLSRAIEQSAESVVITDREGSIEYVNDAFVRISGYSRHELIGRNPRMLQSGRTPAATYESMWAALTAGHAWRGEFWNARKDGRLYLESGSIAPIRQADGEITHYVAVMEDVTEKRSIAAELERYRHRLEDLVAERTAEVEDARRQAESANRAKSAFLANMSHEIRTPMNGMLGMLEVLARGHLTEQQREMVRIAQDSGRTLLDIIDEILDFSKIEAGRLEIERASTSVLDVVEGLCDAMLPLANRRGVRLGAFVSPEIPARVWSDPLRLRQILYNLVGNAIKFSAGRGRARGRVAVRATLAGRVPMRVAFAVSDNGIGMAPEVVARLFEPFSQGEVSTTRRYGGTGLGLTICRRLVDRLQGEIGVSSTPGEGTTFTVTLPVELAEDTERRAGLVGILCLLVDGPGIAADDLCAYLAHDGAAVQRVADEAEAARVAADATAPVVVIRGAGAPAAGPGDTGANAPDSHELWLGPWKRIAGADPVVRLDLSSLRRRSLVRAVAVAAGRARRDVVGADATGTADAQVTPPPGVELARDGNGLILVAEDDEVSAVVLASQIALLGRRAEFAPDGAAALRMWRAGQYDMVLTDLHMPEMDGYGLTAAIRAEETHREPGARRIPIVALTANALTGEAERAKRVGFDGYLTKPLQFEQLRTALELWLGRSDGPPANAARPQARESGAVDLATLSAHVGDDPATHRNVLGAFVDGARRQADELRAAVAGNSARRAAAVAHKLKASSRAIGAHALADVCASIERAGRSGDVLAVAAQILAFDAAFRLVDGEIAALISEGEP